MPDRVEISFDSIRGSLMPQQRVSILRGRSAERCLPIMAGIYKAEGLIRPYSMV